MADKIKLVQGDTLPQIKVTITDQNTGEVVDITGATCLLKMRAAGSATLLDTLTGTVTNGAGGEVVFSLNADTLTDASGAYEGEVEVTFPNNGGTQTVYDLLKFQVRADF